MGEAQRTIIVHIWDDDNEPNGLGFGLSGFGVQQDEIKCAKDKAGMHKKDPHKVTFEINNRSSRDWLFPSNEADAIWIGSDASDCPKAAPAENAEFPVKSMKVSPDREQLVVKNLNSCVGRYKFSLNFVEAGDRSESKLYPYDPIWSNQNGGRTNSN
jgi:hypothetical protein